MPYPNEFPVHDVYKTICSHEELKNGFQELHEIFKHYYEDILNDPAGMLLPIYDMDEYGYFSGEARASREESYKLYGDADAAIRIFRFIRAVMIIYIILMQWRWQVVKRNKASMPVWGEKSEHGKIAHEQAH